MNFKAPAHIKSLNGEIRDVTILERIGDNLYKVDFEGVLCKAIFNWFNGTYYADDVYAIIKEE